jgi:hypothetical protein
VEDRFVSCHHREAAVVMEHFEAELIAIEVDRGGGGAHRQRGDRLAESDRHDHSHLRSSL